MKKNVLLTGATGGIGEAICHKLSKNYNLVVVSRNQEKLKNFMKDNQSIIKRITCDLKDSVQIIKMIEEVVSANLNIDVLVNNAGVTDDSLFIRMNYETLVLSVFLGQTCQHILDFVPQKTKKTKNIRECTFVCM